MLPKSWPVCKDTDQKAFYGDGKLGNSNFNHFSHVCLENLRKSDFRSFQKLALLSTCFIKNSGESSQKQIRVKFVDIVEANSSTFCKTFR